MRGLGMTLRADLRRRRGAWMGLAVVVGIAAGASLGAIAGARRTASAYPRFLRAHKAADIVTGGIEESTNIDDAFRVIRSLPQVAWTAETGFAFGSTTFRNRVLEFSDLFAAFPIQGGAYTSVDSASIVTGRLPRPDAVDEAAVAYPTAQRFGMHVGDTMTMTLGDPRDPHAVRAPLRVVGIEVAPGQMQGASTSFIVGMILSPAFGEKYRDGLGPPSGDNRSLEIGLRRGTADIPAFVESLGKTRYKDMDLAPTPVYLADVQKALHPYSTGLWLLGIVGLLIGAGIAGYLLARELDLDANQHATLRALGVGRRALFGLGMARAGVVALLALPVMVLAMFAISPLMPFGDARVVEPSPGVSIDPVVAGLGAAAVVIALALLAAIPAWRSASSRRRSDAAHPSTAAAVAARASASAPAVAGLRMAFERGRGRTAVPVASTIVSVVVAVAALVASGIFSSSLHRLLNTPEYSGYTYDALVIANRGDEAESGRIAYEAVRSSPVVAATSDGDLANASVAGREVFVLALPAHSPIGFSVIDGRAPVDPLPGATVEIAAGPTTLRRAHWRIGQTVDVTLDIDSELKKLRAKVVGTVATPQFPFGPTEPGDGLAMTLAGLRSVAPKPSRSCCYVRFARGVDLATARTELQRRDLQVFLRTGRGDLTTLSKVAGMPSALALVVGLTAALVLAYALLTSISRRRRDLAILKTLGFARRELRRAVQWQSSAITFVAVALAIPLGVALGRYGWRAFALQFGVVPKATVPWALVAELIPAGLLLANFIALVPARSAARTRPALVLRSE